MVLIRKASLNNFSIIISLWKEFMKNHDEIVIKKNKTLKDYIARKKAAQNNYKKFVEEHIKSGIGVVYIAEINDSPVGFTLTYIKDEIPIFKIEKIGYVSDLFVKEEFRGMGISSKLMEKSIQWLTKKNIRHVSLGLYSDNEIAHTIYKKWDFFDYKIEMRKKI
ncbi:hypothetical protein COV17_00755 [Candidatus Woesearchaeota archaeon CG10_big_fil_rev_8_21_14_0_10_36_11]|nr:MAG: hypothetical protein COV17_00755 [Candidatus Woesearchaeota archaeon CG10_big_fil_rev_8_21_14_0_10_36_11]